MLKDNISQHIILVFDAHNWKLPTQLFFPRFLGKNIKNCPPNKLFLFTSLLYTANSTAEQQCKECSLIRAALFSGINQKISTKKVFFPGVIFKISVNSDFLFVSYAWLGALALLHKFSDKKWLYSWGNNCCSIPLGGNVLLGGKQQIDAKNYNFEIFESTLYMKSVRLARILERRLNLVHPHSRNKSDFTDLIFPAMFCKL